VKQVEAAEAAAAAAPADTTATDEVCCESPTFSSPA